MKIKRSSKVQFCWTTDANYPVRIEQNKWCTWHEPVLSWYLPAIEIVAALLNKMNSAIRHQASAISVTASIERVIMIKERLCVSNMDDCTPNCIMKSAYVQVTNIQYYPYELCVTFGTLTGMVTFTVVRWISTSEFQSFQ